MLFRSSSTKTVDAVWKSRIRQQEKGRKFEDRYSALYYKLSGGDVEQLSESSNETLDVANPIKWVAFKDQVFSSVLIAESAIKDGVLVSNMATEKSKYLKYYTAEMVLPFNPAKNSELGFRFFYGPNQYSLLKSYDKGLSGNEELELKRLVPLGWGIFRWINQLLIIQMFNLFGSFICNYGIII